MFKHHKQLRDLKVVAVDGDIGHVHDCYFDDAEWVVRYVVVDTGGWLSGRRVLIVPAAIERVDLGNKTLRVDLTREQVENSPDIGADKPVSRQLEEQLHEHYGWPIYWAPTAGHVGLGISGRVPPRTAEKLEEARHREPVVPKNDPHLRSIREVEGYHIQATDGEVGHVEDFVVDRKRWVIRFVIVDTRNWLPGRKVLVAPDWFVGVEWSERKAYVDLTTQAVKDSPRYAPSEPVEEEYAGQLHDHYGRPNRWSSAAAAPVHW